MLGAAQEICAIDRWQNLTRNNQTRANRTLTRALTLNTLITLHLETSMSDFKTHLFKR